MQNIFFWNGAELDMPDNLVGASLEDAYDVVERLLSYYKDQEHGPAPMQIVDSLAVAGLLKGV